MTAACLLLSLAFPAMAQSGAQPLKGLNVALYHAQATRDSVRFLMDYYRDEAPYMIRPDVDSAQRFLSALDAAVGRPFASASNVERPEEASRAGADLVAVLEARAVLKRDLRLEKRAQVALRVEFRDLSGRPIVALEAVKVQGPFVDAKVRVRRDLYRELAAALDSAAADLEAQIRASPELSLFASVRSGSAAASGERSGQALSSDVDNAFYRLDVEPSALAWVVGIDRYQDGSSAPYAERDAAAVRSQLIGLGWPDRNVVWLAGKRADRQQLRQSLEAFRRRSAGATRGFLYFAGRTITDPKAGSALLAWDGGEIPLDDILDAAGVKAVVMVEASAALAVRPGLVALSAASASQVRLVDAQEGHGLFTLQFLKALTASADKTGRVTARGAFERAAAKVRELSEQTQAPVWAGDGFGPVLVEGQARQNGKQ